MVSLDQPPGVLGVKYGLISSASRRILGGAGSMVLLDQLPGVLGVRYGLISSASR